MFDVNVMGLTICTQQALKLMKEGGVDDGHIIHINRYLPKLGEVKIQWVYDLVIF